jgi:opacity protein-like surface antigen
MRAHISLRAAVLVAAALAATATIVRTEVASAQAPFAPPSLPSFNVGIEGGWAALHSSLEETQFKVDGGVAGATFGARWNGMNNSFVGVQGTLLFPFVTASGGEGASFSSATQTKLQTLATADLRVGAAFPTFMFLPFRSNYTSHRLTAGEVEWYAFIGVAAGSVKVTQADLSVSQTLVGPTAGVGAAINVAPNVQVFSEFRYFNLLDRTFPLSPTGPGTPVGQSGVVATAGVKITTDFVLGLHLWR